MTHPMHPLAPLPSIKLKIGTIILAAVGVTIVVFWAATKLGLWPSVSGILAGICALVITRYLARGLTLPLREMSEATTAMARGDYERRVNMYSKDEIGQLAADTSDDGVVRVGSLTVDVRTRRVTVDDEERHLTPTEFDLLAFLMIRPGTVYTREQLLADVWGYRDGSGPRTVDSHVRALRRKIGSDVVRTVHGVGYSLEASA